MVRRPKNKRIIYLALLLLLVGFGLLVYSTLGLAQRHEATHNPHPTILKEVITKTIKTPDETPLKAVCDNYKVADKYPERIEIPSIGVNGCLEQVGLTEQGAIAVPSSIYTAAWYVKSQLPGQLGLSVIDGHISGYYNQDGIFQHLYKLRPGDTFTVTLGSGKTLHYSVVRERSVPLKDAVKVLLASDATIKSQLNLITCGGQYDKKTKLYDRRIIVTSKLVATDSRP